MLLMKMLIAMAPITIDALQNRKIATKYFAVLFDPNKIIIDRSEFCLNEISLDQSEITFGQSGILSDQYENCFIKVKNIC